MELKSSCFTADLNPFYRYIRKQLTRYPIHYQIAPILRLRSMGWRESHLKILRSMSVRNKENKCKVINKIM